MPRIERILVLLREQHSVEEYLAKRTAAALSIQSWYRDCVFQREEAMAMANVNVGGDGEVALSRSLSTALRSDSQKAFQAKMIRMKRASDLIESFLRLLLQINPLQHEMKKKSHAFNSQVKRVQRWWRAESEALRRNKLRVEKQWASQERILKSYAEREGTYLHSVPKSVRTKVVSDTVDRYRRARSIEYRAYLKQFTAYKKKNRYNVKWALIKQRMGIPPNASEYAALFACEIKKPKMSYEIDTVALRKLIQRTSKKQMMRDMQQLLGADCVDFETKRSFEQL